MNHAPGHNCIEGKEAADNLAREGIDGKFGSNFELRKDADNSSGPTQVIANIPALPKGSDESDANHDIDMEALNGCDLCVGPKS